MQQVAAGSVLDQQRWDASVTLFTESQCIVPHLYGTGDDAIIHVEATGKRDDGDARGSQIEFKFGDRFRGQSLSPKPLSATGFGQETGPRPIHPQTLSLFAMELATAGFLNLVAGQAYTNVPLERKELRDAGAEAAELLCRMIYYHLAGITAYNSTGTLWTINPAGNVVRELDAAHRFWCNGNTTDAGVAADTAALLTVEFFERIITKLMSRAHTNSPMAPGKTPWGEWFVVIIDPEGNEQMTRHSSSNRYTSLTLSEIQGGNAPDKVASYMRANAGFQGTRNILYLVDDYVPFGCSGTTSDATTAGTQIGNVRRAMILGRFAAHLKWGEGFDNDAVHIKASYHREHQQESWKFFTHMGVVATRPDPVAPATASQRFSSATVAYYVDAATPLY